jgi:hypothetical protein
MEMTDFECRRAALRREVQGESSMSLGEYTMALERIVLDLREQHIGSGEDETQS